MTAAAVRFAELTVERGGLRVLHGIDGSIAAGRVASGFARSEFQVVQFLPLIILPQLLLCRLLVARERMPAALHAISDALPMSYAVDGMHHLSRQASASGALLGDIGIVLGFATGALMLGAATLRRRTD